VALAVLLAAAGLVLLAYAADQLVLGAARLAARLRIAPIVVGVVVIGLGTSAPEFLVSGLASARGEVALAVGNMTGSNVINLTLVLGIAALIRPVAMAGSVLRREAPLMVVCLLAFAVAVTVGLNRWWGVGLALAMVVTSGLLVRFSRTEEQTFAAEVLDVAESAQHRLGAEIPRALIGLVGVLAGAQLLVTNAVAIATALGVSQALIGFTLVAGGTSLPELVTVVQAQRRGESDLLVGNLLGSDMFNSLGGGATIGLFAQAGSVRPVGPDGPIASAVLVVMVAVGLVTWFVAARGTHITRSQGAVLLAVYAASVPLLL
jgi:cation:H+ antiporter